MQEHIDKEMSKILELCFDLWIKQTRIRSL